MRSSSRAAAIAALLGLLAALAIPAGAVVAQYSQRVGLLQSLYGSVPVAIVLGLLAVLTARRARLNRARSVFGGRGMLTRSAQLLAWLGLWIGISGGVALAVYGALRWASA
jgi:hypothetical protein